MKKNLGLALGASALSVIGAAALLVGTNQATPLPEVAVPDTGGTENSSLISELRDERAHRNKTLRIDGLTVVGEGVSMPAPGVLDFSSATGVSVRQRVSGAAIVAGTERRPIERQASAARSGGDATHSSIRYDDFFAGLDLEYRYDGRDVEEFFHVDDQLRDSVGNSGSDIELTALFPGLTRENAYVRPSRTDPPHPATFGASPPQPDLRPPHQRPIEGTGQVELYASLGRFTLPPAVAFDDAGHRRELVRRFEFGSDGLEVRVTVPGAWLRETSGHVVVDPSIIDNNRQIEISGWNSYGYSMVKTSNGNLHVVYAAVYNGRWAVAHSRSTNNGISWTTPALAFQSDATVFDIQPPTIAVDANDTIHAVWATYGEFSDGSDTLRETYAMLMQYARCANGCVVPNWQFQGTAGGKVLTPNNSAFTYQYNAHLAVDSANTAHITFMNCSNFCEQIYMTIDASEVIDDARPGPSSQAWSYGLFIDANDVPEILSTEYFCDNRGCGYFIVNYFYSAADADWVVSTSQTMLGTTFASPDGNTCNNNYAYAYALNGSVGPDGNIHLVMAVYTPCGNGYFPAYIKFDPNSRTFSEGVFVDSPSTNNGRFVQTTPIVTVDVNNVPYVIWSEQSSRKSIFVAHKDLGQQFFTPREQLVRATNASDPKALCSKFWPAFMRGVDGNNLHVISVFGGNQLQYISTGAPLDAPTPTSPRNSTYVATTQPTFAWQRLRTDNANGSTTYTLEVDERPSFDSPQLSAQPVGSAVSGVYGGPSLQDGRCYYWRLYATNAIGEGPRGDPQEFCVDLTPPAAFQNVSPADGSDPATRTPRFQWSVAAD